MIRVKVPWLPSVYRGRTTYAITIAPFVLILPKYANDPAMLAHEQKHLDQVKATGWLRWYGRYVFSPAFRRQQEAEGYAVQRSIERKEEVA